MLPVKPAGATDRLALRTQIDENLRRVYDEVLTEAVPDRFLQLLDQLNTTAPVTADAEK
ncbi:NepR family anti-sigma factor [Pseudogemmobacter bohemicus]|uniref:NepR family anti-sigma factor n=1 Tax=Pseudogemmobacter bohemicus TaxID=2250708 RepID=UPI001300A20B|nr:NepR family anti-sigma factor [Pseudogemmobacter bohemicus]